MQETKHSSERQTVARQIPDTFNHSGSYHQDDVNDSQRRYSANSIVIVCSYNEFHSIETFQQIEWSHGSQQDNPFLC
ncbi:hypothetical protein OUZ56_010404 [Daphnia magna]|uniref:Uncharacterized protein n=1 Tax=Daphnia magna TaxID=35525 RepID=A0ABR0AIF7_9CRUS|nr:hypothetical protein OUZ56_010404 [Daphnia magna]